MKLENLLKNKDSKERASLKAKEIAKVAFRGKYKKDKLEIEIIDIQEIEGGVSVYAKAWNGKKQLGFGKDGSVEIERFNIYNPPILVPDENGDIERKWTNEDGKKEVRRLREDPEEALKRALFDVVPLVGKDDTKIVKGKRGNTVSTFYPDPNTESSSHDGRHYISNSTYSTANGASDSSSVSDSDATWYPVANSDRGSVFEIRRGQFLFDTSAMDGDTVDSATLSIYGNQTTYDADDDKVNIYAVSTASNTAISTADFGNFGTSAFSTQIDISSWTTGAYNDFALNTSGIANIVVDGISKFGFRSVKDVANTAPSVGRNEVGCYFADQSGTSTDPKLVVERSSSGTTFVATMQII